MRMPTFTVKASPTASMSATGFRWVAPGRVAFVRAISVRCNMLLALCGPPRSAIRATTHHLFCRRGRGTTLERRISRRRGMLDGMSVPDEGLSRGRRLVAGRMGRNPFIGRQRELAMLLDVLEA